MVVLEKQKSKKGGKMKKIAALFVVALMSLVFSGCTATRIYMDKEWVQPPAKVKVLFTEPYIERMDDLRDDLPEYADNFPEWYKIQLAKGFEKYSSVPNYSFEVLSDDDVTYEPFDMGRRSMDIPRPNNISDDADIYVLIYNIRFGRNSETRISSSTNAQGVTVSSESTQYFFFSKGFYVYYDAKTKKCIGFDEYERRSPYNFVVSKSDWETVTNNTVKRIIEKTPLQ